MKSNKKPPPRIRMLAQFVAVIVPVSDCFTLAMFEVNSSAHRLRSSKKTVVGVVRVEVM